jgi:3-methylcrotonyl-CoA carboxylase beta subunit
VPLVFLQNITGFMVGKKYENEGIARHGAKMVTGRGLRACRSSRCIVGGSFGAGNYGMCGRAYSRPLPVDLAELAHLRHGRRAGGATCSRRAARRHRGQGWRLERRRRSRFKAPIRAQYEDQGNPYYATARLWDDGVIDPCRHAPLPGAGLALACGSPCPKRASASSGCDP